MTETQDIIDKIEEFSFKFSYLWSIKETSLRQKKLGEMILSPIFSVKIFDTKLNWRLKTYPKGFNKAATGYLSIFIELVSSNVPKVTASFELSILNAKKEKLNNLKIIQHMFKVEEDWGYHRFIDAAFILNKTNGFLFDKQLTISCEGSVPVNTINVNQLVLLREMQSKVPEYQLTDKLVTLYENKKFSDVTLSVAGKEFKAHKVILAAGSPVFAAMFEHDMQESKRNKVEISDMDPDSLEEMLKFIYTGKVTNLEKLADNLLAAADKYDLPNLKQMCEEQLCDDLSITNAVEYLILADLHSSAKLKKRAIDYICNHATDIINSESWNSLIQRPDLLALTFIALAELNKPTI